MIYLYNKELEKISEIGKDDLKEFTTTEELNSQWIVEISYPFSLHKKEAEYIGFKDNNEFKLYKIINTSRSDDFIDINGVHIFFHDLKGKVIRDIRPSNKTALQVATEIFKDTDWQVFSTVKGLNSTNFYYISKLDAFYDLLEKWQCEFRLETYFDGDKFIKKIYLEDHISKDYGRWFEYGDKLLTVIAEENHSNVFTAFIGRGKGEETGDGYSRKIKFDNIHWSIANGNPINKPVGQDYIEIKDATKLYGYPDGKPRIAVIDFDDEENKENLLRLTYEYALENSRPKLQLKATAADDKKVELGEVCAIIRPNLDIRYKTRIFKVKTDRLSDLQEFEFGDKIVISRSDRIRAEQKIKEKELQEIESRLEQALKNVDFDFNNEDGYNYDLKAGNKYNLPAGYYSFNKPIDENPTKVVYMGAGKVLIADEKGSDGSWKWDTAIDGNGIYGGEIIGHSITANKLAPDVGQSLDLSSNKSINLTVKKTTQSYIDENKDQLKGDKGDKGERGLQGLQGPTGEQGIPGKNGKDGTSSYTHIAYANSSDGKKDFSVSDSTNKLYIGMYVNEKKSDSDDPKKYKWTLIKGQDGKNGTPGAKGDDGKTPYLHIAYSNSADGKKDFSVDDSNRSYIGQYTNYEKEDSTDPKKYTWSKIKGDKGAKGDKGDTGEADYTQFRKEYSAELNNLGDRIESIVESTNTSSEDTLNALSELNQSLNGTMSEEDVQKLIDELNDKISEDRVKTTQTSKSYTQKFERIEAGIENSKAELVKLSGVIKSGLDENGKTYTDWIGDGDNRVRVGSDGIVMLSSNAETLKLKDGRGYMNSLYVKHELGLGNHTARKMGTEFTVFMPMGGQNELDS